MIRFLADADLDQAIGSGCLLREPAMDFLLANRAGLEGVPDPDVLALAAQPNRILVTHDLKTMPWHFGDFLASSGSCPSVFLPSNIHPSRTLSMNWCLFGRLPTRTSGKTGS
jgi:hypothetical protein